MDYIQGDPNYQESDYYSYNPETEEGAQDPARQVQKRKWQSS
jgi:hypothetical protein